MNVAPELKLWSIADVVYYLYATASLPPLFSLYSSVCPQHVCLLKERLCSFGTRKSLLFCYAELRIIGLRPWPITALTLSFVILHITHSPGPLQWIIMVYDSFPLMYMITLTQCFFIEYARDLHIIALMREHIYKTNKLTHLTYSGNTHALNSKRPSGSIKTTFRRQQSKAGPNLLH